MLLTPDQQKEDLEWLSSNSRRSSSPTSHSIRERFSRRGNPILSVDTKKKELVGRFKNPGRVWAQKSDAVNDHDFRSTGRNPIRQPMISRVIEAPCMSERLTTRRNSQSNASRSGGALKVRSLPGRKHLLVVADTGGQRRNPPCMETRHPAQAVQRARFGRHGRTLSTGASKWNPIEHRLFSEISKNWAGRPLDSYETILNFIRTTKTKTGLKVNARLVKKQYPKGFKISDPAWRYSTSKNPLPCRSGTTRCVHPRMGNNFCHGPNERSLDESARDPPPATSVSTGQHGSEIERDSLH